MVAVFLVIPRFGFPGWFPPLGGLACFPPGPPAAFGLQLIFLLLMGPSSVMGPDAQAHSARAHLLALARSAFAVVGVAGDALDCS